MLKYSNNLSAKEYCELRSTVSWQPIIEEQAQSGLKGSDFMIACRDDDNIVGCARIFWDKGYIAYLADVMVKPEYQKQGIGKGFFEIARKQVKEAGYNEFIVAVNSQNVNAIQFYLAMGGKIVLSEEKQLKIEFVL